MTGSHLYRLPPAIEQELQDAARVQYYEDLVRQQMTLLGVPDEAIGNVPAAGYYGRNPGGAFRPDQVVGGTHTPFLVEGVYVVHITVDAAVLDVNHPAMTGFSPGWPLASLAARFQAVAAHEYLESVAHQEGRSGAYPAYILDAIQIAKDPGADPLDVKLAIQEIHDYGHFKAVKQAPTTQRLNPDQQARQLLDEYRQWAVRNGYLPSS